jgi:hypothetical protein
MRGKIFSVLFAFGILLTATAVGHAGSTEPTLPLPPFDLKMQPLPPPVKGPDVPPWLTRFFVDVSGDALNVFRNNSDAQGLVVPTAGPGSIFSAQDFSYGHRVSYDRQFRVGYDPIGFEYRALGGIQWNSPTYDAGAVGSVKIGSFSNFGATDLNGSGHSTFGSHEMNVRFRIFPWLTPFVGYRKLQMTDDLAYNITFPAFTAVYDYNIPWQAKGWQVGIDARLFGPGTPWEPGPFFGDIDARVGSFNVSATTNFNLLPSTGGSFPAGSSYSQNNSRIYEVGGAVGYRFGSNLEIRAGYRALVVPNALFASDYAAASTAQNSQAIVPNPRRLTVQMATIGARFILGGIGP